MFSAIKANKNTTITGIALLCVAIGSMLKAMFDGDPATNVDYNLLVAEIGIAIGLILGSDAKKEHVRKPTDPEWEKGLTK